MGKKTKYSFDEIIRIANDKFHSKYSYENFKFNTMVTKSSITCPKHGDFQMNMWNHAILGQGCPKCNGRNLTTNDLKEMFKEIHGDRYSYEKFSYTKMHDKSTITCKIHGDFKQTPSKHLLGQGCPKCANAKKSMEMTISQQVIVDRATAVHNGFYSYDKLKYNGMHGVAIITCPRHGDFTQIIEDHLNGHGCPKCGFQISRYEVEISEFIKKKLGSNYNIKLNDRSVLNGREIDILIPSLGKGIEFNGSRWHSEEFGKDENYHLKKKIESNENGVELIEISEDIFIRNRSEIMDIIFKLISDNVDESLIESLNNIGIISIDDNHLTLDRKFSTNRLNEFIIERLGYNTTFVEMKPRLIEENVNGISYKVWNCGYIVFNK